MPERQTGIRTAKFMDISTVPGQETIEEGNASGGSSRGGHLSSRGLTTRCNEERVPLLSDNPRSRLSRLKDSDDSGGSSDGSDNTESASESGSLPWYRRPSPWWVIAINPLIGLAITACVAAKVQLYTQLVCLTQRPEYTAGHSSTLSFWKLPKLPEPSELCMSDPGVQASVATLMAALGTSIGTLSILTTVAWGELSDRRGRTPFLGLTVFGTLLADVTFILVSYFLSYLPGGYRFLLFGYVLEGMTGGLAAATAANNAYIADCCEPEARSRFFSLNLGVFCIGIAAGPTLGGILISSTADLLSVFYLSAIINLTVALVYWFIVPESLPLTVRREARLKSKELSDLQKVWESICSSLSTLSMFVPRRIAVVASGDEEDAMTGRNARAAMDWNMLLVAICGLLPSFSVASFSYIFEYTGAQFAWRSEQLGYYLTATGATRTIHLMILLPLATNLLKPKSLASASADRTNSLLRFDILIVRASLLVDLLGFVGMASARLPSQFILAAMVECLGSGYAAAMQSAALELYRRSGGTETGKLFGALSVIQSIGSQIFGSTLFGAIYKATVTTFPQAIFVLCSTALGVTILATIPIRIRAPLLVPEPDTREDSDTLDTP